jgi:hypothetical protein
MSALISTTYYDVVVVQRVITLAAWCNLFRAFGVIRPRPRWYQRWDDTEVRMQVLTVR